MQSTGIASYNSSNLPHGLFISASTGDLSLYHNDTLQFNIYQDVASSTLKFGAKSYNIMTTAANYYYNTHDFTNATVTGNVRKIYYQSTPPSDTNGVWFDTTGL
jgi:hypothetical protein